MLRIGGLSQKERYLKWGGRHGRKRPGDQYSGTAVNGAGREPGGRELKSRRDQITGASPTNSLVATNLGKHFQGDRNGNAQLVKAIGVYSSAQPLAVTICVGCLLAAAGLHQKFSFPAFDKPRPPVITASASEAVLKPRRGRAFSN